MCGIVGQLTTRQSDEARVCRVTLQAMSDCLIHRGPDGSGLWLSDDRCVGLAHRRLSILDLSEAGAQPMQSQGERFVITFNGEIYNHLDLRQVLEQESGPIAWRGHSDTETLVVGIGHWGLAETLTRAYGMFALAVWDRLTETLSLARDRMGEKPLYLARIGDSWVFASELQTFRALGDLTSVWTLNEPALADQLATGVIPDMSCVLSGVRKVRPGTILELLPDGDETRETVFEDFQALMASGKSRAKLFQSETADAAANRIEQVLGDVISSQMISDVPLGSFLSGGVDSSLVTALMQSGSERAVKTFSIGFEDLGYDESRHAETVAEHLGTEHQTFHLREEDALDLIPQLAKVYGEPFADSSQIPTLLLCHQARKHVTVALTGDGGDEIFGGYNRHVLAPRIWPRIAQLPTFLRRRGPFIGRQLQWLGGREGLVRSLAGRFGLSASVINKAARFGEITGNSSSLEEVYRGLTRQCDDPSCLLKSKAAPAHDFDCSTLADLAPAERLMALDSMDYLPSDVLVKVDRAAMHASLETRAPFLDARVIREAWSVDLSHRIRGGVGKAVLRDILFRHVPRDMIERPKQGFAVPIDAWLRGPLNSWAEGLLSRDQLETGDVLDPDTVRQVWAEHLSGRVNRGQLLWSILILQQWLDEWASRT